MLRAQSVGQAGLRPANTAVILGDSITQRNTYVTNATGSATVATTSIPIVTSNGTSQNPSANVNLVAHGLTAIGVEVGIANVADPAYKGVWKVTAITDANNFTVALASNPTTNGNSGSGTQVGMPTIRPDYGWFNWANSLLGQRLQLLSNQGLSGDSSAGVLARVNNALSYNPGYLFVLAGINDFGSLTAGNFAATVAATWANLQATYQAALNRGCAVVALTILPVTAAFGTSGLAYVTPAINWVNRKIRAFCATTPGMILVDTHGALADASSISGYALNGVGTAVLISDGTHPGQLGAFLMGQAVYNVMNPILPQTTALVSSSLESYAKDSNARNVLNNPLFIYTSGGSLAGTATGQVADGWLLTTSGSPTVAGSLVARTLAANGDTLGNSQKIVVTQGAAGDSLTFKSNVAYANQCVAGDVMQGEAEVTVTGASNVLAVSLVLWFTVGGVSYLYYSMSNGGGGDRITSDYKAVLRTPKFTIPSGTITVMQQYLYVAFNNTYNAGAPGTATIQVARAQLAKQ